MSSEQANNQQSRRSFSSLEELGLFFSHFIKDRHPIPEGAHRMVIHDDTFNRDFMIERKGDKTFVSLYRPKRKQGQAQAQPETNQA